MTAFIALCVSFVYWSNWHAGVWIGVFVLAWIGQFIGHKIEGVKPSFLKMCSFCLSLLLGLAMNMLKS